MEKGLEIKLGLGLLHVECTHCKAGCTSTVCRVHALLGGLHVECTPSCTVHCEFAMIEVFNVFKRDSGTFFPSFYYRFVHALSGDAVPFYQSPISHPLSVLPNVMNRFVDQLNILLSAAYYKRDFGGPYEVFRQWAGKSAVKGARWPGGAGRASVRGGRLAGPPLGAVREARTNRQCRGCRGCPGSLRAVQLAGGHGLGPAGEAGRGR